VSSRLGHRICKKKYKIMFCTGRNTELFSALHRTNVVIWQARKGTIQSKKGEMNQKTDGSQN
jgi:hypothetical protein